ncbi:MAG: NUDIX hydrolase [Candidatus Thermoplasmatota archaeon]|nr:NUDIX hydrolase [Candidatus Thermoplasmatota archaeon]GIR76268.1 MAG: hypothetical protein CM15mP78_09670 [Candidatus Poseidoniales archaeon]MEC8399594.1 NUDIX hydrolase [Candidatus Thermoplasmatota archaeon]MEC8415885.1 NUDIX hydrolase [Candidatus Thermoplasmatota archaeon]MEC8577115.1 NUDIX hydrolase [Candidatus Thermoplasmatota archaeon]
MTNEQPRFVLAWVTREGQPCTMMGEGGEVLFVEHPKRGWEIPGGHLESGETPEQALHRELKEETGLSGHLVRWNTTYYPEGWVAHVVVADDDRRAWTVSDDSVHAVQWWDEVPPVKAWTVEEFEDLATIFARP